jgi:alpha-1,6-mannosyltransferase
MAAVGVMLYAWWALRDLSVTARWSLLTAVLWFAPLLLSAPLFSRDIYSYAVQGLQLELGGDPYHEGIRYLASPWTSSVSRVWLDSPAPYGPLFIVLARLAARAAQGNLLVALAILRLLATGGLVVLGWAVPAMARRLHVSPASALWLGLLCPIFGLHLVSGAHNDALMVAGMAAAVALALDRRYVWACLLIGATMAVKAPAAVVLPFIAILAAVDQTTPGRVGRTRLVSRLALAGVLGGAAFVAVSLATGLGFSWVGALSTPGKTIEWTSLPSGLGMGVGAVGTLFGHNVEVGAVSVFRTVALVVLAAALVVIWVRALRRGSDRRFVVLSAGLALSAVVVLAPAFHPWYLLWALPFFAVSVTSRRVQTALAVLATVLALSVLPGGLSLALFTAWVGVPLCFAATGILAVLGWRAVTRRSPGKA